MGGYAVSLATKGVIFCPQNTIDRCVLPLKLNLTNDIFKLNIKNVSNKINLTRDSFKLNLKNNLTVKLNSKLEDLSINIKKCGD